MWSKACEAGFRGSACFDVVLVRTATAYRMAKDAGSADPHPLLVDVRIRKLRSWVNMGFWAITMNADVETSIHMARMACNDLAVWPWPCD